MSEEHVQVIICGSGGWGIGAYKYVDEDGTEQMGYGFYRPENPNDFFPDGESCRPEEIEAHRQAKEAWNAQHDSAKGEKNG